MLYRNLLIAGIVTSVVAITGCSKKTEQAADAGNVEAAAESAGQDTVDNAQTAGAVATGAAINAGEAIADGAHSAVEGTSNAVSNGSEAVAEGTNNVVDNTAEHAAVDEDQQY
ncbi:hypothetical protein [Psychrobacter sp.]|uniref:hypothetical protein n=1 Tax=Psychrobacter sp. TaxID=56811 RepID=UPI0025D24F07|nr:hypothetical protein [Psychrobacter sp.]